MGKPKGYQNFSTEEETDGNSSKD